MKPELIERLEALIKSDDRSTALEQLDKLRASWAKADLETRKVAEQQHVADGGDPATFIPMPHELDQRFQELVDQLLAKPAKAEDSPTEVEPVEEPVAQKEDSMEPEVNIQSETQPETQQPDSESTEKKAENAVEEVKESEVEETLAEVSQESEQAIDVPNTPEAAEATKEEQTATPPKEEEAKEAQPAPKKREPIPADAGKSELITLLQELVKNEDLDKALEPLDEIREFWAKTDREAREAAQKKFVADGGDPIEFIAPTDERDGRYKELVSQLHERRKKREEDRAKLEAENLAAKTAIIDELTQLNNEEENIGRAFQVFRNLQEKWKATGPVPNRKYKELQALYSREMERFFYNINIYKELQEHDLKRNLALKMGLVIQMQELSQLDNIRKLESMVQTYQTDWDEIGPTFREKWDDVSEKFRLATSAVYQKIRDHYGQLRDQQKANLDRKTQLCEKAEAVLVEKPQSAKQWQDATNKVLELQKEWRTVGFAPKKKNEVVWQRFRDACDQFFGSKKSFFDATKDTFKQNKNSKRALIDKALVLKDSTDWQVTTKAIIQLQQDWKKVGAAQQRDEQKLWKQFREACDHFFNAKKQFFGGMDERQNANLEQKKALIENMTSVQLEGSSEEKLAAIREFSSKWSAIGPVPSKVRNELGADFSRSLEALYQQLDISRQELAELRFREKVERLSGSEEAENELIREQRQLNDKIKKLDETINQYENNMGFFANTKGENPFMKEIQDKIGRSKEQRDELQARKKVINKALRDLSKS